MKIIAFKFTPYIPLLNASYFLSQSNPFSQKRINCSHDTAAGSFSLIHITGVQNPSGALRSPIKLAGTDVALGPWSELSEE